MRYPFPEKTDKPTLSIRSVPLDFDHPIGKMWTGLINPYHYEECSCCSGGGWSPEAETILLSLYKSENFTQEEVDHLIGQGRLINYTHDVDKNTGDWVPMETYSVKPSDLTPIDYDTINCQIVTRHRAEIAGINPHCPVCDGEGVLWFSEEFKKLCKEWEPKVPPHGLGYQVWCELSDNQIYPISVVFTTKDAALHQMFLINVQE